MLIDHRWRSPLAQGRGLKRDCPIALQYFAEVAPRAGAWIEIFCFFNQSALLYVTPRRGVWIEISKARTSPEKRICHSPQGSVD